MEQIAGKRKISKVTMQKYLFCFYALLPILFLYSILRFYPLAHTIYLSFHDWNLVSSLKNFVGLGNFVELMGDITFLDAVKNTLLFVVVGVPITVGISLAVALLIDKVRISSVYEFIYYLPVITSMVAVAAVWQWIYDSRLGLLNYFLSLIGIRGKAWLIDPNLALWSIMALTIWKEIGYFMIILLLGLRSIPKYIKEAAEIDGVNAWQMLRHVILPLMKPMIIYVVSVASIRAFKVFTQVYVMTGGVQGSAGAELRVIVTDIYEKGFRFFRMGYASAEAMVLFVLILVATLVQLRFNKNMYEY